MDHWAIVKEAWATTRRQRGLWGFGAINAAQTTITTVMAMVVGMLFAMSMMLMETLALADVASSDQFLSTLGDATVLIDQFVSTNAGAIIAVATASWLVWLGIAVVDVSSTGGLIHESDVAARGDAVSFGRGMSAGWRHWWRVAGLYAIQVLPSLVMMAGMALLMWVPLIGPTLSGTTPVPGQAMAVTQLIQPLASLTTLIALPLGVIVMFALRFAVIQDMDWRSAFSASWRLVKANLGTVALFFLVMWGVATVASMVLGVVMLIATALQVVSIGIGMAAGDLGAAAFVVALLALIEIAGFFALTAAMAVLAANAYTLAWRELIAKPVVERPDSTPAPATVAPASVPLDGVPPASPVYEGESL